MKGAPFDMSSAPTVDLVLSPFDARGSEMLAATKVAEQAGIGGIWTFDHLSGAVAHRSSVLESFTLLGAIAAVTSSVIVGPLVANVANRHPAVIANAAATLQELSGGRAWLGLGAGAGPSSPFAGEQMAIGRPVPDASARRQQLDEAVEVIRRLSSEDSPQSSRVSTTGSTGPQPSRHLTLHRRSSSAPTGRRRQRSQDGSPMA